MTNNQQPDASNKLQAISLIREFRPTIVFLAKFLALYLILNLGYGLFIDHYSPAPDPVTRVVSRQSTLFLNMLGFNAGFWDHPARPAVNILNGKAIALSVFEGCNGLNVVIIFIAFLLSYGKPSRKLFWYIPVGILIIHLTNVIRILLLYGVTLYLPDFMYFAHKYLFTAIIYIVVFVLWFLWVNRLYADKRN